MTPDAGAPVAPVTVERVATARMPTEFGEFDAIAYESSDGGEHLALVVGDVAGGPSTLARIHSECLTGEVFHSHRCDCGPQLDLAMRRVQSEGRGVIVYVRGHEGRGIGIVDKIRAYALQDTGLDTVDANTELGLPVDARTYGAAAAILADLGVTALRLMSNNPAKASAMEQAGFHVEREPLVVEPNPDNYAYLTTKRDRLGHSY